MAMEPINKRKVYTFIFMVIAFTIYFQMTASSESEDKSDQVLNKDAE